MTFDEVLISLLLVFCCKPQSWFHVKHLVNRAFHVKTYGSDHSEICDILSHPKEHLENRFEHLENTVKYLANRTEYLENRA